MNKLFAYLFLLAGVAVSTCLYAQISPAAQHLIANTTNGQPTGAGYSVSVIQDGKVLYSTASGKGVAVQPSSQFMLASVTKQLTAAAIVALEKDGALNFDDSISKFIPELKKWEDISIRALLQHRTNIPDYVSVGPYFPFNGPTSPMRILSMFNSIQGQERDCTSYSNTNYYALGVVIERASGMSYGSYLDKKIFTPLGMTRTRYAPGPVSNSLMTGINTSGTPISAPYYAEWAYSAGGVISTAEDMAKWLAAVFDDYLDINELLDDEVSDAPQCFPGQPSSYGLGWIPDGGGRFKHPGKVDGFATFAMLNKETGDGVVVLSNYAGNSAGIENFAKQLLSISLNPATSNANYCCTAIGRFGPGLNPTGAAGIFCRWPTPIGFAPGTTCF